MALSEGNRLHAVFWDDRKRLWYTTKITNAAWIPPETLDNVQIQPALSPNPVDTPLGTLAAEPTKWLVDQQLDTPSQYKFTPGQVLILSLSPAILLVILIVASRLFKSLR
jgi:hypothetical protein